MFAFIKAWEGGLSPASYSGDQPGARGVNHLDQSRFAATPFLIGHPLSLIDPRVGRIAALFKIFLIS